MRMLSICAVVLFGAACGSLSTSGDNRNSDTVVTSDYGSDTDGGSPNENTNPDGGTPSTTPNQEDTIISANNPAINADLPRVPGTWRGVRRGELVPWEDQTIVIVTRDLDQVVNPDERVEQWSHYDHAYPAIVQGKFLYSTDVTSACTVEAWGVHLRDPGDHRYVSTAAFYPPSQFYCTENDGAQPIDANDPINLYLGFLYMGAKYTNVPSLNDVPEDERIAKHRIVVEIHIFDQAMNTFVFLTNFALFLSYQDAYEPVSKIWWENGARVKLPNN